MIKGNLTLSIEEAAATAEKVSGTAVTAEDIQRLIKLSLLQVVGDNKDHVFEYQVGIVGGTVELAANTMFNKEFHSVFSRVELTGHTALTLAKDLVVFFVPGSTLPWALRAFIRLVRDHRGSSQTAIAERSLVRINESLYLWGVGDSEATRLQVAFKDILAEDARTSPAEAACVPSIYGNKSRISDFVVSTVRQWLPRGLPVCDLMTGTGLIARHLLTDYPVHANDTALFANCLVSSQAIKVTDAEVASLLSSIEQPYVENLSALESIFDSALREEKKYLLGGLSSEHLGRYAEFCSACTHFVPDVIYTGDTDTWSRVMDDDLRQQITQMVSERRRDASRAPFLLATAYWANCYFGMRQSLEVDSLCYAIRCVASSAKRQLMQAVLLASIEACSSGPHFAQPPTMRSVQQIRRVIDKRSQSVMVDFRNRAAAVSLRPARAGHGLTATHLPWLGALQAFDSTTKGAVGRGVYVDPPYSRLQYSRYYHVFDSLLRYDYPQSIGEGRVSELSKRPSSRFDSRLSSAAAEIDAVVKYVSGMEATLFLSYATGGTVPLDQIYRSVKKAFREVHIETNLIQHHSQGRQAGANERIEVVFVGIS